MDFVKFANDRNRMCNVIRGIGEGCKGCPLDEVVKGVCSVWCLNNPEKSIEVVERWVTHYRSGTPVAEGYVSTCCDMWNNRKSDYCPNCEAKMDGVDDG